MSRRIAQYSGLALSVIFLALILRKVDFAASFAALKTANYWFVALGSCLYLASFFPRGLRWRRLMNGVHRPPLSHLIRVLLIGFMANNVLPLRLGEFFRAYVLGVKEGISKTTSFATIVLERVADGLTLVAVLAFISVVYPFPSWVKASGALGAGLFLGALLFLLLLTYREPLVLRLAGFVAARLPRALGDKAMRTLTSFTAGLHFLRSGTDVLTVTALSVVIWCCELCVYTSVTRFGFGLQLPVHVTLLLLIIINFGILVPSAPAYIGPFQAAAVAVLTQVAFVDKSVAFSVAWVLWATMVLPVIAIGLVLLSTEHLSLVAISHEQDVTRETPPEPPALGQGVSAAVELVER